MTFDEAKFNCTVERLIDILQTLDENDTPTEKLPDCPRCGEDELGMIHADLILCYRCNWKLEGKRKEGAIP